MEQTQKSTNINFAFKCAHFLTHKGGCEVVSWESFAKGVAINRVGQAFTSLLWRPSVVYPNVPPNEKGVVGDTCEHSRKLSLGQLSVWGATCMLMTSLFWIQMTKQRVMPRLNTCRILMRFTICPHHSLLISTPVHSLPQMKMKLGSFKQNE